MMAHVNTSGRHIPLWIIGPQPSLGWGKTNSKPMIESAFFGNIFVSPPKAYYCNGPDYDRAPVGGRIGAETSSSVFHNPYSGEGLCNDNCQSNSDGYTSCSQYTKPITVYRDLDPSISYHICRTYNTNSCLEVYNNSTASGAAIRLGAKSTSSSRQQFYFERYNSNSHDGAYRIKSKLSGKYLSVAGGSSSDGAGIIQETSSTSLTQQRWNLREITRQSYVIENQRSMKWIDDRNGTNGYQAIQDGGGSTYDSSQEWKLILDN
jgi:hypothetical protein